MGKRKEFIFKNVLPFHMICTGLVIIPTMALYGILYYILFNAAFKLSFVMLFTLFYFGTCYLILKGVSVEVKIWFDDHYLYIKKGNRRYEKYSKADIIGFYSYDYETKAPKLQNSKIYFKFNLKNKKNIYLYDVEYRNQYEEEKGTIAKRFLKESQQELHFTKIKKKNHLQNIYWYSNIF
ncbi:hypothetical protein [Chryseobacterium sp. M5A1_1a]